MNNHATSYCSHELDGDEDHALAFVASEGERAEVLIPRFRLNLAGFNVGGEVSCHYDLIHDMSFQLRVISLLRMNRVSCPSGEGRLTRCHFQFKAVKLIVNKLSY